MSTRRFDEFLDDYQRNGAPPEPCPDWCNGAHRDDLPISADDYHAWMRGERPDVNPYGPPPRGHQVVATTVRPPIVIECACPPCSETCEIGTTSAQGWTRALVVGEWACPAHRLPGDHR